MDYKVAISSSIGGYFEKVAVSNPDKTAIIARDASFSYNQLNSYANQIANTVLLHHGNGSGRIALLFDQCASAIAATIGVLKAGHVFVPLDASNPAARISEILNDCQPMAILTSHTHADLARQVSNGEIDIICLEDIDENVSAEAPSIKVSPEAIAYIFYTSGSTGAPKGVCQRHRNLLHFVSVYSRALNVTAEDRLSLLYSLSFSASNLDIFAALLNSATVCLYDIRKNGTASLAEWIDQQSITLLHAVPTVFRHLLQSLPSEKRLTSVAAVDLGGETVYPSDIDLFRQHFTEECLLINHLAATEASVIAQYQVGLDETYKEDSLPVGFSAEGMEIRIVREDGSDAAVSEPGELLLYSEFLSPGYWQQPDLTAAAFAVDVQDSAKRFYRSGDLGYMDPDQKLYFLGRKGLRIKVRGHTVDLSEVEAAIRTVAEIKDVAVVAKEKPANKSQVKLAGYLVRDISSQLTTVELRKILYQKLPGYMVPSALIYLDELPLTTSGKIDRKALTEMDSREIRDEISVEPPRNGVEHKIALLCQTFLEDEPVNRMDDFFLIGGDSLNATQLHACLEDLFKIRIPLENLFADATVAGMAEYIQDLLDSKSTDKLNSQQILIPLREQGSAPILFLIHGVKGQAFVSPHFLRTIGEEQPVYAFQATGLDRTRLPKLTIEGMASEYISAMRKIQPTSPYFIGSLCAGGMLAIEMALQLHQHGQQVAPLMMIDPPVDPLGECSWLRRTYRLSFLHVMKNFLNPLSERRIIGELQPKSQHDRIELDFTNAKSLKHAAKVALDLRIALTRYNLPLYEGPVLILGSRERLARKNGQLRKKLRGDVKLFDVGQKHGDVHDITNDLFANQLVKCIKIIHEALDTEQ